MSTKFYIKDENGSYLSIDGKTKYTLLEGKALYDFLKTEDGKRRCFHVEIDDDGNKIGIEATHEFIKQEESEKNHAAYLERQKVESGLEIISANIIVRDNETDVELIETIVGECGTGCAECYGLAESTQSPRAALKERI